MGTTTTWPNRPLETLPAGEMAPGEPPARTRPLTILVVDDYPANRLLLSRQLSYLGHQVLLAEDGQQGFEQWREHACDLVVTDCNMPVVSGYELTGAIRDEERFQKTTVGTFDPNNPRDPKIGYEAVDLSQVASRARVYTSGSTKPAGSKE